MKKESKGISGLRDLNYFTISERHKMIQEMISLNCTKREIWEKYTGKSEEHGQIINWMRELGYSNVRTSTFVENNQMTKKKANLIATDDSFENLQLKKRITELERQLKDAEMKAIAFSTMVDIAEKQFNIPIRKKVNTKP